VYIIVRYFTAISEHINDHVIFARYAAVQRFFLLHHAAHTFFKCVLTFLYFFGSFFVNFLAVCVVCMDVGWISVSSEPLAVVFIVLLHGFVSCI